MKQLTSVSVLIFIKTTFISHVFFSFDNFFFGLERKQWRHRTKCLFPENRCISGNVRQNGRLKKQWPGRVTVATGEEARTSCECISNVVLLLGNRPLMHQRSDVRVFKPRSDRQGFNTFGEGFAKRLVDRSFNQNAICREAVLTGCCEFCGDCLIDGMVKISICKHEEGGGG